MVAACRDALLISVFDVLNDPMGADPDRIEAPPGARRALRFPVRWVMARCPTGPQAGSVSLSSERRSSQRRRASSRLCTLPGPNRRSSPFGMQAPVAGIPVRQSIGEVERVNQRRVGVSAEQHSPFCILFRQPGSEGHRLPRLHDSMVHAWRSVIARCDKRCSLRLRLYASRLNPVRVARTTSNRRSGYRHARGVCLRRKVASGTSTPLCSAIAAQRQSDVNTATVTAAGIAARTPKRARARTAKGMTVRWIR
jgi:hypothetical protein